MTDEQLHAEFRTLSELILLLVTKIEGHPTLQDGQSDPLSFEWLLDSNAILNAAVRVLVRNNEILALAGKRSTSPGGENMPFASFTVIPNPDEKDKYFKAKNSIPPEQQCLLVESYQSHWRAVSRDRWYGLTLKSAFFSPHYPSYFMLFVAPGTIR